MKIKIHTQGIKGSGMIEEGEEATALFRGVLEVDGLLIDHVGEIHLVVGADEIAVVKADLFPGSVEVIAHTKESWSDLLVRIEEGAVAA